MGATEMLGPFSFYSALLNQTMTEIVGALGSWEFSYGPSCPPTPTPVPPTGTPAAPSATPTVPPTATLTATEVPPTATEVPPTATLTATPTATLTATEIPPTAVPWTPEFVIIPAGEFTMGSPETELCRYSDETQHTVILTQPLVVQTTEVTQEQWVAVFGDNPSYLIGLDHPVEMVTWFDAVIYCNRISAAEGLRPCYYSDEAFTLPFDGAPPVTEGTVYWDQAAWGYRLPTESEWEYACRAGTGTAYNSGQDNLACDQDANLDSLAWYSYNSGSTHHSVCLKTPNVWDLCDMHGNVWEWCWDWDGEYPAEPVVDPIGPPSGTYRVLRGGSLHNSARHCRSAYRSWRLPGGRNVYIGFRVVRRAPQD